MTTSDDRLADAQPIASGLLAFGMSGQVFHAPFLTSQPGFALVVVTERHTARAAQQYPTVRTYGSVEALVADPAIELVVVNTPPALHLAHATLALRAGKHVLVEKPLATSPAEVRALYAAGRQAGRHVFAYQNRRYDADFRSVEQVLASGRLGPLIEAHFRYDRYRPALSAKAFKETPGPGAGLLYDLGPHLLDQALLLFGRPARVHRVVGTHRPGGQVDDFFSLQLHYPSGSLVTLTGSLLVAQPGPAYVLHGRLGTYQKGRTDPQEAQLQSGLSPTSPLYGHEDAALGGTLTLIQPDGARQTETVPAVPGHYGALFAAIRATLRTGAAYPITEEQQQQQAELLAGSA